MGRGTGPPQTSPLVGRGHPLPHPTPLAPSAPRLDSRLWRSTLPPTSTPGSAYACGWEFCLGLLICFHDALIVLRNCFVSFQPLVLHFNKKNLIEVYVHDIKLW